MALRGRGSPGILVPAMAKTTEEYDGKGILETTVTAAGFCGVFGGMAVGAASDLLRLPVHAMAAYAAGVVGGAFVGMIIGRVAAPKLLAG
jgi:hypothetical protein